MGTFDMLHDDPTKEPVLIWRTCVGNMEYFLDNNSWDYLDKVVKRCQFQRRDRLLFLLANYSTDLIGR